MIPAIEAAARALTVLFWMATSVFAWLGSVPFAYENFIRPGLVPPMTLFAEYHAWLAAGLAPAAWLALREPFGDSRSRPIAAVLLGLWALAALVLPWTPPLAALPSDGRALVVSALSLVYPIGCALVDLRRAAPLQEPGPADRTGWDALATALAASLVWVFYSAHALGAGHASPAGLAASALTHALAGAALLLGLTVLRGIAALRERPVSVEFRLATLGLAVLSGAVVVQVILPALSVTGASRRLSGIAVATAGAIVLAARGRRAGAHLEDGVLAVLSGLIPVRLVSLSPWPWLAWLSIVVGTVWGGAAASRVMDWNFVVLTLSVLTAWTLAVGGALAFVRVLARAGVGCPVPATLALPACAAVLALYLVAVPAPSHAGTPTLVDRWTVADASFRTLRDALRPPTPAGAGFYPLLQRHTNLGADVAVRAFDIRHARLDGPPAAFRPHIFLIVVDSLRRDYLSPYNPRVSFTPQIGAFGAESLVFRRAFTRYGATGLSVPSIWVGGLVPHKQYPRPYAPFNALHALLAHHRYETWLSWDNVVDAVVPREGSGPALSTNRSVKDFRFCEMIGEVRARLDRLAADAAPVFTWGLPQDIHISAITREGGRPIDHDRYEGFHAPYASRVKRLDACFGAFIDDLKARGLYQRSIVILTADHGDSLGEDGRWGHAYTLFPEVLQVPLLVHLPARLQEGLETDPEAPAFTSDITPTLYALLGHETTPPGPMFGVPLVWPKGEPPRPRPAAGELVASSYGSVYGWISDAGRQLYVADGVSLRDHRYEIDGTPAGRVLAVSAADRFRGQTAIRDALDALARFYRLDIGQ